MEKLQEVQSFLRYFCATIKNLFRDDFIAFDICSLASTLAIKCQFLQNACL